MYYVHPQVSSVTEHVGAQKTGADFDVDDGGGLVSESLPPPFTTVFRLKCLNLLWSLLNYFRTENSIPTLG